MTEIDLAALPEKPEGWTRKMLMHMSFGDGGMATFDIFDPAGIRAPFQYQYDTRPGGLTGFYGRGIDGVLSWPDLRAHYAKGE